jgi:hypothetical protein
MSEHQDSDSQGVRLGMFPALLLAALLLGGCEQVFTFSPVSFLQRPASSMTPAQQIAFGQQALASGDTTKMAEAYTALSANASSKDAQYTAAQIGVELSGAPQLLVEALSGSVTVPTTPEEVTSLLATSALSPDYLIGAANNLVTAASLGETLGTTDLAMAAVGRAFAAAQEPDGSFSFDSATWTPEQVSLGNEAQALAQAAAASVPPSDPLYALIAPYAGLIP